MGVSAPASAQIEPRPEPPVSEQSAWVPTFIGDGRGIYAVRKGTFVVSFALHVVGVVALLTVNSYMLAKHSVIQRQVNVLIADVSSYVLPASPKPVGGGGGGGDRDKLQAPHGALPKFAREQITPPAVVTRNENPKLIAEPTVVVPPDIVMPHVGDLGDPLSNVFGTNSNGPGSGGGIGSGRGGGVGSGTGPGVGPGSGGGIGGGVYRVGAGVSPPTLVYAPDPEYSEEARKAKYMGTVIVWMIVGTDGRPHDVRVV